MGFDEILEKLRKQDERVTQCFFFWDGPTLQRIDEVRRTDPVGASRMRRPVCNTCRPALLKTLHTLYGDTGFDYNEKVTDFYFYLMEGDKLSTIRDPRNLMGWIVKTAYYFFLNNKKKESKVLDYTPIDSLFYVGDDVADDDSSSSARRLVQTVLDAMPNRVYAEILDKVTLEVAQYKGHNKIVAMEQMALGMNMSVDTLYVKISRAKRQFKDTALKLDLCN